MKVVSAEYVKSAMRLDDCPKDGLPETAFAGRSNVGKSSLLNKLLHRKKLAQVSKSPGKTRTINYFLINEKFYFVDLPGYGYAKVSKQLKEEWGRAITRYIREREQLRLIVHLVDARHKPTRLDHEMLDLLAEAERPALIVATKFDKVKASQRSKSLRAIHDELGLPKDIEPLPVSSETGHGINALWQVIRDQLD